MNSLRQISRLLDNLSMSVPVKAGQWPCPFPVAPADIGLKLDRYGNLFWRKNPERLKIRHLEVALSDHELHYFPVINSTNTWLVAKGAQSSIANQLCFTEFQHEGRGRRGRTWISPFARNLAMSLGIATQRPLFELGGLSLVVGLALADALESLKIPSVSLKWPNDILINGSKLSGILVELVQRGKQVEYVVGIGVNVHISAEERAQIDQPVADLREHGVTESRTDLVILIIRKVQEYLNLFEQEGFRPFVTAFNDLHLYHGETCALVQGDHTIIGEVQGIGEQGELLLLTPQGVQSFHGGEVSLRPQ